MCGSTRVVHTGVWDSGSGRVIHMGKAKLGCVGHTGVWAHTGRAHWRVSPIYLKCSVRLHGSPKLTVT